MDPTSDDDTALVRPATPDERADVAAMHASNKAAWDEAAERYERWLPEAIELIKGGGTNLLPPELEAIGDLHGRCRRAIHLQCAGGRDTLSLWNLGADEVVGVDFSPRMLELAERLSSAVGAPARWIQADVLDTPHDLDGTADLVYTGRGSLVWLQDLDAWATGIASALKPGGLLLLYDTHPVAQCIDGLGHWRDDYFDESIEQSSGWEHFELPGSPATEIKHERHWQLGQIVAAVTGAGLQVTSLAEFQTLYKWLHRDRRVPWDFALIAEKRT
jgi:SAM-dependent methyltransferase